LLRTHLANRLFRKRTQYWFSTHGIIKKTGKVPESEIEKAEKIRIEYFNFKNMKRY